MLPSNPQRSQNGMLIVHPALHLPPEDSPLDAFLRVFIVGTFAVVLAVVGIVFLAALS